MYEDWLSFLLFTIANNRTASCVDKNMAITGLGSFVFELSSCDRCYSKMRDDPSSQEERKRAVSFLQCMFPLNCARWLFC